MGGERTRPSGRDERFAGGDSRPGRDALRPGGAARKSAVLIQVPIDTAIDGIGIRAWCTCDRRPRCACRTKCDHAIPMHEPPPLLRGFPPPRGMLEHDIARSRLSTLFAATLPESVSALLEPVLQLVERLGELAHAFSLELLRRAVEIDPERSELALDACRLALVG